MTEKRKFSWAAVQLAVFSSLQYLQFITVIAGEANAWTAASLVINTIFIAASAAQLFGSGS